MSKWLISIILISIFLSGCNNVIKEEVPVVIEEETEVIGTKEEYIQKLTDIDESLADLQDLTDEGTTLSMKTAADETYKRWDTALNEIYAALQQQLSTNEVAELKEVQATWLISRDEIAKKQSLEFEGGTMEPLVYMNAQARVTKERCYELVEQYMK